MSKWIWIGALGIAVVAVGGWWASKAETTVEVIQPRNETVRAYVEERAVTDLAHDHLISMPISGWLERIDLREGDPVVKGEVVASLETDDLRDRAEQAEQRIAVLEAEIAKTRDNRLEEHMLVEANAVVKAIEETVRSAEEQLEGSLAIYEFAKAEVERLKELAEEDRAAPRELSEAMTEYRKTGADYRSDVLELAALKTLAAVSYIGPQYIKDMIDRKSFDLEKNLRELDEAKAELEIEKRNLSRAEIKSPIDGVVLQRHQTRRQYLQAGTPLLTVGQLAEMEIVAEVLTERATTLVPGTPVEVFGQALSDGPIKAEVTRVYPAGFEKVSSLGVEQQRVNVIIKPQQRPPNLGVGFRVHVRIFYDQADGALTLPRTALFRSPEGTWQVMVVRERVTQLQPLELGILTDDKAQIISGLSSEDTVIAHPSREIEPQMNVESIKLSW